MVPGSGLEPQPALGWGVVSLATAVAGVADAHALVRSVVTHVDADRDPQPDLAAGLDLVRSGRLAALVTPAP